VAAHAVVGELAEQEARLVEAPDLEAVLDLVCVACQGAGQMREADVAAPRVIGERGGPVAQAAQRLLEARPVGLGGELLGIE
jgi:hypothetical protein